MLRGRTNFIAIAVLAFVVCSAVTAGLVHSSRPERLHVAIGPAPARPFVSEPPTTTEPPVTTTLAPPDIKSEAAPVDVGPRPSSAVDGLGPCGGDLPPCWVVLRESATAGLYSAYNPDGCGGAGCFGKWQFSGEWAGKLGLPLDLRTATPEQQDNAARILWAGGAGCSNWSAC